MKIKALFVFWYGFFALSTSYARTSSSFMEVENRYLSSIDNEYIKAKLKYGSLDTGLFNDIQELKVSISLEKDYSEESKVAFYEILFGFVRDINTSLYASRRIEEREYRRIIRLFPSVFHYIQEDNLREFLIQNPNDAVKVIPYLSREDATKTALVTIALDHPSLFYTQVEELASYKYFSSVFLFLGVYDPVSWVAQVERNPFLTDIAAQSSNPIIKKVLSIKDNQGINSNLYYFLDDIVRNSFNESHDVDFMSSKEHLTKKLLDAALNPEAYGYVSSMNGLSTYCKWIFEHYIEGVESVLDNYTNSQILVAMVQCHPMLEYNDYVSLLEYMKKNKGDLVERKTLKMIPKTKWYNFLKKIQKAGLVTNLTELLDTDAALDIINYDKAGEEKKLPYQNTDWFSTPFNYEKDKQERQYAKNKVIATTFHLNKTQLSLLSWSRNLNKVDSSIVAIVKSAIGPRFIDYLAEHHPQILANNRNRLKSISEFPTIVNKLCEYAPNTVKKYLGNDDDPLTKQVRLSSNPSARAIVEIYHQYKFNTRAYALLDKILLHDMTIARAHEVGSSHVSYMRTLMNTSFKPNAKGLHSVEEEQNQVSLKFIREINDNPSSGHPNLQIIRSFSSQELYSMMVLGKEEIFQFAFDYFYRYFTEQLGTSSILDFFPKVHYYRYREFCVLMANFKKFAELFYRNTTDEQRRVFLKQLVHIDFSDVKCIEQAAAVCEFINICDHSEIQSILQRNILEEYKNGEENKDQLAMAVYSLLASNIGHRAIVEKDWFLSMEKKYNNYTLSYISVDDMKDKKNKIIEVSYFYNDADGVASFNSYINTFRGMSKWYVQDLGTYYFISSLEGNDYVIFANKPQSEQAGQNAIKEYLVVNNLEPSIIVHRGHSYHSQKTIDQMVGSPKFIFMGSCGGYYKIGELLVRSPNAQILSTKQVGTMGINDPMLKSIHEIFRTNQNIVWSSFWTQQEARLGGLKDFKMYVPPHRNNGALFVNAFFKVVGL